jgi:hypothetical protein
MEQNAKNLLKRISEKVSTLTEKKISLVAHASKENEWRAYMWQSKPHWEDIAWRVKEPNAKGETDVHLGFYSAKPSEDLAQSMAKAEGLAKGNVNYVIKNENGIRLVWKVNLNDEISLDKLYVQISNLLNSFLEIALDAVIKSSSHTELPTEINSFDASELNDSSQEISNLTNEQIDWINSNSIWDFDNADPQWKNTKSFTIYFMNSKERSIFSYLSDELKRDVDVAKTAISFDVSDVLRNLPESLKENKELVVHALEKDGRALQYLPTDLKFDKDFILPAMRQTFYAVVDLRFAPEVLLKDSIFIDELCAILKEHTVTSDWKEVLKSIPFEVLNQTTEDFKSYFENLTRDGISKYRIEVSSLTFDANNPKLFKKSLEDIYRRNLPVNGKNWLSSFDKDGFFYYDSEGEIMAWGSEDLLYPTLAADFIENTWKPAMESASFEQLIKMLPDTIFWGSAAFMCDNDLANWGYRKVMELLNEDEKITLEDLFVLLNSSEEFFNLKDDLPEVHQRLVEEVFRYSLDEMMPVLHLYQGHYFLQTLFDENQKMELIEEIKNKISENEDDDLRNFLDEVENEWES